VPSHGSDKYVNGVDAATGQLIWTAGNYGLDAERAMAPALTTDISFSLSTTIGRGSRD
jgi:hypothetical protein